jgi:hypothetical protein
MVKSIFLILIIGLAIVFSGCTGSQDVTSVVKALPEVQLFMNEHPNAVITVTYWSKEEVTQSLQEISQQCDKSITPVAMYKAIVSEGNIKIISWINAENQIIICSITQGSGSPQTSTPIQTSVSTKAPTASIVVSNNPDTPVPDLKISHKGGDTLKDGEWKVSLVEVGQPPLFKVMIGDFSAGGQIIATTTSCDFGNCPALLSQAKYDVKLVHIPSNTMLIDTVVEVRGTVTPIQTSVSTKAPTASIVAANNPDSPGVDIKISHKGGDLLKAGEWKVSVVLASNPPVYVTATSTSGEFGVGSQIKVTSLTTGCNEPVDSACIITNSLLTTDGAALVSGTMYDVKMVHIPSNAMLVDTVLEVR